MEKNKALKITLITFGTLLVAGLGTIFAIPKIKELKEKKLKEVANPLDVPNSGGSSSSIPVSVFPIKRGDKGANVEQLQKYLYAELIKITQNMNRPLVTRTYAQTLATGFKSDGNFAPKTASVLKFIATNNAFPSTTEVSEVTFAKYQMEKY